MNKSIIAFAKAQGFEKVEYVKTLDNKNVYQLIIEPFTLGEPILIIEDNPVRFCTAEEAQLVLFGEIIYTDWKPEYE